MSHFATLKTALTDKASLIASIETIFAKLGATVNIQVSEGNAIRLRNDWGTGRGEMAEVVVPKEALSHNRNTVKADVGFVWNGSHYEVVADEYELKRSILAPLGGATVVGGFTDHVQLGHDRAYLEREYPKSKWHWEEVHNAHGEVEISIQEKVMI